MYDELAAKRQRLLKKAYGLLKESQECIFNAMVEEIDGTEVLSMELWTDKMSEILEDLVDYTNEVIDEEAIADEFLYGRM